MRKLIASLNLAHPHSPPGTVSLKYVMSEREKVSVRAREGEGKSERESECEREQKRSREKERASKRD